MEGAFPFARVHRDMPHPALSLFWPLQADFNMLAGELGRAYPDRARLWFAYDEPLSHLIYAGADVLLVPSIFEPCGLTQMIAMRCAAAPKPHPDTLLPSPGRYQRRQPILGVPECGARSAVLSSSMFAKAELSAKEPRGDMQMVGPLCRAAVSELHTAAAKGLQTQPGAPGLVRCLSCGARAA